MHLQVFYDFFCINECAHLFDNLFQNPSYRHVGFVVGC